MKWLLALAVVAIVLVIILQLWRRNDDNILATTWLQLVKNVEAEPALFDLNQIDYLPEPAQRFFRAVIKPGTPLHTIVEVNMTGEFSLGTQAKPNYIPMHACQLLAPPYGFIWRVAAGRGFMKLSGSDAAINKTSWTRFWLRGLLPVARLGNNSDHRLSSFGRYMADSLFWSPACFLPSEHVVWEARGPDAARVTVTHDELNQTYDINLNVEGYPTSVSFQRWSDANDAKVYQRQPFGGYLSEFKEFNGFTVPTNVVAGNHFGTEKYFPFFKATVNSMLVIDNPNAQSQCN